MRDHCTEAGYGVVPGRQRMKVRHVAAPWPPARRVISRPRSADGRLSWPLNRAAAHHSPAACPREIGAAQQRDGTPSKHPANCRIGQSAVPRSDDAFGQATRNSSPLLAESPGFCTWRSRRSRPMGGATLAAGHATRALPGLSLLGRSDATHPARSQRCLRSLPR